MPRRSGDGWPRGYELVRGARGFGWRRLQDGAETDGSPTPGAARISAWHDAGKRRGPR